MRRSVLPLLTLLAVSALLLAACGTTHKSPTPTTTTKAHDKPVPQPVYIYSGLPLHGVRGSAGSAIATGIRLAMSQPRPTGSHVFQIKYTSLDDTVNTSKKRRHPHWVLSLDKTAQNATRVEGNPQAVFYIGDLESAATEISLQVLNVAGIPQVTPGSGYVGLTDHVKGVALTDEPGKYQANPTHSPTLLRMVPDDSVQATAILKTIAGLQPIADGCTHISIVSESDAESREIANLVYAEAQSTAKEYHVTPVAIPFVLTPASKTNSVKAYEASLKAGSVGCFVIAGRVDSTTIQLAKSIHVMDSGAFIIGSSGLCNPGWTNPRDGGVPAAVAERIRCVSPNLPLSHYPGSRQFEALYHKLHPRGKPTVYTFYGYTAAEWAISSIVDSREDGDNRLTVLNTVIDGSHKTLLGQPFFDLGDIANPWYAVYTVAPNGDPKWSQTFKFPS
jgi:branched-chain amino acid transport system substrate-binding protein